MKESINRPFRDYAVSITPFFDHFGELDQLSRKRSICALEFPLNNGPNSRQIAIPFAFLNVLVG